MAIGPIELTGMVTRSQDISLLKQNEDNKPILDQNHIQVNVQKKTDVQTKQVRNADNADYHEYRYDAKEKGNGSYQDNRKKDKNKNKKEDGKVVVKQSSGFDMKI